MWASLIPIILEFGLKAFVFFMDKSKLDAARKMEFYKWVQNAGTDLQAKNLMEYASKQIEFLKTNPWKESK